MPNSRNAVFLATGWRISRNQPDDGSWQIIAWELPATGGPHTFSTLKELDDFLADQLLQKGTK